MKIILELPAQMNTHLQSLLDSIGSVTTILSFIIIYLTAVFARKALSANAYMKIVKDLNNGANMKDIDKLKKITTEILPALNAKLEKNRKSAEPKAIKKAKKKIEKYKQLEERLLRQITNRYDVVAQMVYRNFIVKQTVLEGFSGTFAEVYSRTINYIHRRRSKFDDNIYLRKYLELLGLEAWLYQTKKIEYLTNTQIISGKNKALVDIKKGEPNDVKLVKERIRLLKRESNYRLNYFKSLFFLN